MLKKLIQPMFCAKLVENLLRNYKVDNSSYAVAGNKSANSRNIRPQPKRTFIQQFRPLPMQLNAYLLSHTYFWLRCSCCAKFFVATMQRKNTVDFCALGAWAVSILVLCMNTYGRGKKLFNCVFKEKNAAFPGGWSFR